MHEIDLFSLFSSSLSNCKVATSDSTEMRVAVRERTARQKDESQEVGSFFLLCQQWKDGNVM